MHAYDGNCKCVDCIAFELYLKEEFKREEELLKQKRYSEKKEEDKKHEGHY